MKYTLYTILLAATIILIIWLAIKYIPDNTNEYNNHVCVDVYGKDEDCNLNK